MLTLNDFNLKENPFRSTPSLSDADLIWAGFPSTKQKFERRIRRSLAIPNSSLILNWGEYGSGKTHAARYFSKQEVLADLLPNQDAKSALSLMLNFPKGKSVVFELFRQIIDKMDFETIHSALMAEDIDYDTILNEITDNFFAKSIVSCLYKPDFEEDNFKQYLYGEKVKDMMGILRSINGDNDYVDVLSAMLSFLTYKQLVYQTILIWIDEFEDIAYQTNSNINSINNFIKVLFDKTPNGLLMFINFTQSAMAQYSDLSAYLQDAVKSRIKEAIELSIPQPNEIKQYISELLNHPQNRQGINRGYEPFCEDVIDALLSDLSNISLRRVNEAFSVLLESALYDDKQQINKEYYEEIKNDVIGWKDA